MKQGLRFVILLLLAWSCLAAPLTPAQRQAKEEGILLYKQHYNMPITVEKLLPAAEAGDTEAMVYLGIVKRIISDFDAMAWLEKAANAGDIYAMYQLTLAAAPWQRLGAKMEVDDKNGWRQKGAALALAGARRGDAESMYLYYKFTGDVSWLEKAAEAGRPEAQEALASFIAAGEGRFKRLSKKERNELALLWWHRAANNGSAMALHYLSFVYGNKDRTGHRQFYPPYDLAKAQGYLIRAVELGYLPAVQTYAHALLYGQAVHPKDLTVERDIVKAYMFALILRDSRNSKGQGLIDRMTRPHDYLKLKSLPAITPEQIAEAERLKLEWVKTHPPLAGDNDKLKDRSK